ncbi:ABC transporter permease [Vibrio panuliri]|uniref:ABC transporter permease n=1 Tax=Vibrio panuliri TaxID=1381081 RepID=A0ABX3F3J3_9VIBR|nr:ABC transporter permease [Vibrio panuliri]KAB1453913.1 ABC transporter permease [Vibrio panuliri]OLQ83978.1 ABC transporter permease [Vibrio panuliri]
MKQEKIRNALLFVALIAAFWLGSSLQANGFIEEFMYYSEDIAYLAGEHIKLTLISGSIAVCIGIPAGIWLSRPSMQRYSEPAMQVFNIGTTVPTLAVLALSMTLLGIGNTPAIFALAIATILPIVRNTYTGLISVPDYLKEAATGMGLTPFQQLIRVELPNAMFVIMAGIRTAFAINIGTVPLAFLIGGTGLGELIFTGIDLDELSMMLAGAIPTATLAVVMDMVLGMLTFLVVRKGVNPLRN